MRNVLLALLTIGGIARADIPNPIVTACQQMDGGVASVAAGTPCTIAGGGSGTCQNAMCTSRVLVDGGASMYACVECIVSTDMATQTTPTTSSGCAMSGATAPFGFLLLGLGAAVLFARRKKST